MLQDNCPAPFEIKLKIGAPVVLLRNLSSRKYYSDGLVNGSQGIIVAFDETKSSFPIVQFSEGQTKTIEPESWSIRINGLEVASRKQIPLKLAWALTIHRCQGKFKKKNY